MLQPNQIMLLCLQKRKLRRAFEYYESFDNKNCRQPACLSLVRQGDGLSFEFY